MYSRKPSDSKHNKAKPLTAQQDVEDLHQILRWRRRRIQASTVARDIEKISGGVTPESIKTPLVFHNPRGAASERHPARLGQSLPGRVYVVLRYETQSPALLTNAACHAAHAADQTDLVSSLARPGVQPPPSFPQPKLSRGWTWNLHLNLLRRLGLSLTFPARSQTLNPIVSEGDLGFVSI
jgi:hypothetical protein